MKKSISTLLFTMAILASCKKQAVTPAAHEPGPKQYLYIYRVIGYDKLDTATVYINGKFAFYTGSTGYNKPFMEGDTVDFYFSGKRTVIYRNDKGTPEQSEIGINIERIPKRFVDANFAIWRNWNNGLNVQYFQPIGNSIHARLIIN